MPKPEPYVWEWTDEGGIRRQTKMHMTHDGREVQWSPRFLGDNQPWFDADYDLKDPAAYCADEDLATLGMPVTSWSGFDS